MTTIEFASIQVIMIDNSRTKNQTTNISTKNSQASAYVTRRVNPWVFDPPDAYVMSSPGSFPTILWQVNGKFGKMFDNNDPL